MLMAAPVPSTGAVARSPRRKVAVVPLANELAGATVVPALALALAVGVADGLAVELAVADPVAVGVAVGLPPFW
jgi:Na+(H+)/acetate symporter ActP